MGSLIEELKRDGSLVLWHRYNIGSFLDWSGQGNDGTPTSVNWGVGGLEFNAAASIVSVPDAAELQLTELTIVCTGDFMKQEQGVRLVSKRDAGGTNYELLLRTDPAVRFYDGVNNRDCAASIVGKKSVGVTCETGNVGDVYVNGLLVGPLDGVSTLTADDAPLVIGNRYDGGLQCQVPLHQIVVCNKVLTASELSQLHGELMELN